MKNAVAGFASFTNPLSRPLEGDVCIDWPWVCVGSTRHSLPAPAERLFSSAVATNAAHCVVFGELFDRASLAKGTGLTPDDSNAALTLAAYERCGPSCWTELNGSFIAVLADARSRTLFVVNDRFASIPLFYAAEDATLAFSTDADTAARLAPRSVHLNVEAVYTFMQFQRLFGSATYYREVSALAPASVLEFNASGSAVHAYFRATYRPRTESLETWSEELTRRWSHSVLQRTEDHPVMLMSGGLDSRAVLAANPELPCVIVADYDNREVITARRVAEILHARLDVLYRPPEYYTDILEAGVDAACGMYPAHMAHTPGIHEALADRACAVIHGNPPEAYFRNSSLYTEALPNAPSNEADAVAQHLYGLFRTHGKYVLPTGAARFFTGASDETLNVAYAHAIVPLFREGVEAAKDIQDQYTYLDTRFMARYPSYVFELALGAAMPKRTPMWDNALYDLHLEMPWQVRTGDALWKAMLRRLHPGLAAVPSANTRVLKLNRLPLSVQHAILRSLGIARRLGLLPADLPADPAYTLGSWPNFDELIRRRPGLRAMFESTLFAEGGLPPDVFDVPRIRRCYDEHLRGRRNDATELFTLLTFALWYRRSPLRGGL